jgi:hypothetical protein
LWGGECVIPKNGVGEGEALASVELGGGVGAVQVIGNLGLAVRYLPPGVAPCKEGGPAGGAENSWSQVVGMRWLTYRLA